MHGMESRSYRGREGESGDGRAGSHCFVGAQSSCWSDEATRETQRGDGCTAW